MKLYYTGANKFLTSQKDPSQSLGGYISNSEVQNATLNNMFGQVSKFTIHNNKPEYRCIVIKNNGLTTLTGLKIYCTYPTQPIPDSSGEENANIADLKFAYEIPTADDCGDLLASKVDSIYSSPYLTFVTANTQGTALSLPDLDANDYIAIWIQRKLNSTALETPSSEELLSIYTGETTVETVEEIEIKIEWT